VTNESLNLRDKLINELINDRRLGFNTLDSTIREISREPSSESAARISNERAASSGSSSDDYPDGTMIPCEAGSRESPAMAIIRIVADYVLPIRARHKWTRASWRA